MNPIDRIPFRATLPDAFSAVPASPFAADDSPAALAHLFGAEADRNETILYTDHATIRLVGIFPNGSAEAYFGFWETANDGPLNHRAFALLEADVRQRGRQRVVGPLNFSTFYPYRLRLNNPSWGRFDREPANPAYYPDLLEQTGYQITSRFQSRLVRNESIPIAYGQKKQLLTALAQMPFDIIPLNPDTWQQHEADLFELVHQVFSANPAYRAISQAQFSLLYNRHFAEKLCPYSSVLFRDRPSGKLVALSFCQPDYQSLTFAPGDGPNFVRDFPRLAKKVLLVKSVGVHPGFRQRGLMSFLGAYGMVHFRELYDDVIFCLMRSDNFSLHFSDTLPHETAHYALFGKEIPEASVSK